METSDRAQPKSFIRTVFMVAFAAALLFVVSPTVAAQEEPTSDEAPATVRRNLVTGETLIVPVDHSGAVPLEAPLPSPDAADAPASFSPLFAITKPATTLPHSPIVKLTISGWPDFNGVKECTGTLISSRWVLTAGECIYDHTLGGWGGPIRVVPALTPTSEPYGGAWATYIVAWQPWIDDQNIDYNVAYFKLDRPVGALAGMHGIGFGSDALYQDFEFAGYGYPYGDAFQINRQHEWAGTFDSVSDRQVEHNEPGNPGMIGSAAVRQPEGPDGSWAAFAIYAPLLGSSTSNFVRLVPELVQPILDDIAGARSPSFDLVPLDVNVTPGRVTAGDPLTKVDFMLFNDGGASLQGLVELRLVISTDVNIDCVDDRMLASRTENQLIAPGDRPRITFNNVAVPNDLGGEYFIGACAITEQPPLTAQTTSVDDLAPLTIDPLIPPNLTVTPAIVQLVGIAGQPVPPGQVSVTNTGGGALGWTVKSTDPWLSVSPASGVAVNGAPVALTISADAAGFGPSERDAQLTFTGANGVERKVGVVLTLAPPNGDVPVLQVSPSLINFQALVGGPLPAAVPFAIDNLGGGLLNWQASADVPWLSLSKTSGSGKGTINVSLKDIGALPRGTHIGTIAVSAPGAQASPRNVTVTLVISTPASLAIDGMVLAFSGETGGETPAPSSFFIRNEGDAPLNWSVSENIPWLLVDGPNNGTGAAEVGVRVQPGGLVPGAYNGSIRVAAAGAQGSPKDIEVTLLLRPGPRLEVGPRQLLVDATAGAGAPAGQSIDIFNRGLGTMNWNGTVTSVSGGTWVNLGQSAGNVGPGGKQTVPLTFNTAALAPRAQPYEATVTINAPAARGGPQSVNIRLTVRSAAAMCNIDAGSSAWVVNSSQVKVALDVAQTSPAGDGGCDVSGKIRLQLPQNASVSANFSGKVSAANKLTGRTTSSLAIGIASFKLQGGADFTLDETNGLQFNSATWQLPADLGSVTHPVNGTVRIAPTGIRIGGTQDFPLPDLNWSKMSFVGNRATVSVATDFTYAIDIVSSQMKIAVSGSPIATAQNVTLRLDQRGIRSGSVGAFDVNGFAGLRLEVMQATLDGNRLIADQARLHMPQVWGGQSVSLYRLSIDKNGTASIGDAGGKFAFSLPSISAGGFTLSSLSGFLEIEPGGVYRINARGEFGLPEMKSVGACRLWVDVTLRNGPGGQSILEIAPVEGGVPLVLSPAPETPDGPASADALVLEQFVVGLRCKPGIPLGNTGLYAVGVEGTVVLKPAAGGSQSISLKLWIESQAAVGSSPMIGIEAGATIVPQPFELGMSATVELIGIETVRGSIAINSRRLRTEVEIQYNIVRLDGNMEVGRLPSSNQFYVNGSAGGSIGLEKGKIYEGCLDLLFDKICANVPPSSVWITAGRIDIGTFNTGGYGLRGYVPLGSWAPSWAGLPSQIGFFINFQNPSLRVGDVSSYQPIKPLNGLEYAAAREAWMEGQRATDAATDGRFRFNDDGSTSIPVPVQAPAMGNQPLDSQQPIPVATPRDLIFILVQEQGSPWDMNLVRPDGVILTPDNLVDGAGYTEALSDDYLQTMYLVPAAMVGDWLVNLTGPNDNTTWGLFVIGNDPAPAFDTGKFSAALKGGQNKVEVKWKLAANEPTDIAIYANDGATTLPLGTASATASSFSGLALATGLNSQTGKATVDLTSLPSGTYTLWIEADNAIHPPVRHYLPGDNGPFEVVVNHAATFPGQWTASFSLSADLPAREMRVSWLPLAQADVDVYRLRVRYDDPLEPSEEIVRVTEVASSPGPAGLEGILDNIEPGRVYRVAIGAVDLDTGKVAWSQEKTLETAAPDFLLAATGAAIQLPACGTAVSVPIAVTPSGSLAEPVMLTVDMNSLPDGISVNLLSDLAGEPTTIFATLSASDSLPAGSYTVAINGSSGTLERTLLLNATAEGSAGKNCSRSRAQWVPVIVRP